MITTNELKGYKKLHVWQEAHALVLLVYSVTKKFPKLARDLYIEEKEFILLQKRRIIVGNLLHGLIRSKS
ncbi:MAG: hypothetical protein ACOY0S_03350 [Patescibacteria group bacterium]